MRIGILGIGLMGGAFAERLLDQGHELRAWNRTREKALALKPLGVQVADQPAEVLEGSEITILTLADGQAILQVLFQAGARAAIEGSSLLQMGTIGAQESREIAQMVRDAGGDYLEAPVLGSTPEAKRGELFVMVGARPEQFRRWHEVFRSLGSDPQHIGEVGQAAALKLALNQLLAAEVIAFGLSLGMVLRAGIDVDAFTHIVRQSALHARQFDKKLPRFLERNFSDPHFPVPLMLKDIELGLAEASRLGLDTSLLQAMQGLARATVDAGYTDVDYSAIYNAVNPPEGTEVQRG